MLLQEEGLSHRAVVNDERNPAVQPAPHRPAADPAQQLLVAEHEPRLAADIRDVDKEQPGALGDELRKPALADAFVRTRGPARGGWPTRGNAGRSRSPPLHVRGGGAGAPCTRFKRQEIPTKKSCCSFFRQPHRERTVQRLAQPPLYCRRRGTRMQDDAPKKEKRPRPSRFQAAALPPGSAATSRPATAATSRPAVSCVAGPRRLRLSRRAETSVRAFMPVSWARLRQHVPPRLPLQTPAARTAPLATGASNLARAGGQANDRAVWAAAHATGVARALASGARRARVGRQSSPAGARPALGRESPSVSSTRPRNQGGLSGCREPRRLHGSPLLVLSRTIVAVAVGGVARRSCICSCRTT